MAIQDITFDQATNMGLNANNELAKIGKAFEQAGTNIQGEFEMQEVNNSLKLYREESEKAFRQSNFNQKSFEELHKPLVDNLLKSASNQRVARRLQSEIDYKYGEYTGEIYKKQQVELKQKTHNDTAETLSSQGKEYQKALLAGDMNRAKQVKEEALLSINNNSLLDENTKYNFTNSFKEYTYKANMEGTTTIVADKVSQSLNYDNYSYEQLLTADPEKDVEKVSVDEIMKQRGGVKIKGGWEFEDGEILTDENVNEMKQGAVRELSKKIKARETIIKKRDADFKEQLPYMQQMLIEGKITDAQFAIAEREAYNTGNTENIETVRMLKNTGEIVNSSNTIQELDEQLEKKYPNDFKSQAYARSIFITKKQTEIKQTGDYWANNGLLQPITFDGGVADVVSQISNRIEVADNLGRERNIASSNVKRFTTQEQAALAQTLSKMSVTELPEFMNNLVTTMGMDKTLTFLDEISENNKEAIAPVMDIFSVAIDNYNPEQKQETSDLIINARSGKQVDKKMINDQFKNDLLLSITEEIDGTYIGSMAERQQKIDTTYNAVVGHYGINGMDMLAEGVTPDKEIVKKYVSSAFGSKVEYNGSSINVPKKDLKVVEENLKLLEEGEISKDFLSYYIEPENEDFILDVIKRGEITIRTDKYIDEKGVVKTGYFLVGKNGERMAAKTKDGQRPQVYRLPLDVPASEVDNKAIQKIIKRDKTVEPILKNPRIERAVKELERLNSIGDFSNKQKYIDNAIQIIREERRSLSKEYQMNFEYGDLLAANWSMGSNILMKEAINTTSPVLFPLLEMINNFENKGK